MSKRQSSEEAAVTAVFLQKVLHDSKRGSLQSLREYQARFPGFEALVEKLHGQHVSDVRRAMERDQRVPHDDRDADPT